MNLKEIRDRLLKEREKEDSYIDGILDFYNEVMNETKTREEIQSQSR